MSIKKVHFAFKWPIFDTVEKPTSSDLAATSVYYWWYEYLKENDDYMECCQNNGAGLLSGLYKDFGNVYKLNAHDWWKKRDRGSKLFGEPSSEIKVGVVKEPISEEHLLSKQVLYVRLPLSYTNKELKKFIAQTLVKYPRRVRGERLSLISEANYRVSGVPHVKALDKMLRIYQKRKWNKEDLLWEIGFAINWELNRGFVLDYEKLKNNLTEDEKISLATSTSRYLKKAKRVIHNTSYGRFPDYSPIAKNS